MIKKNEKGATMIALVMVIMSLVLMIGIGISSIHLKSIRAIEGTEESMRAFYAADSGLERAMLYLYNESEEPSGEMGELHNEATFETIFIIEDGESFINSYGYYKGVKRALRLTYPTITTETEMYTVTYDANSGSCIPSSRTVEDGTTAAAPSCSRSGYTISSFTRTSGSGGTLNTTTGEVVNVTGDQTIRVDWSLIATASPFWSTSFDCAEWEQGSPLGCDGLKAGGGWTCSDSYGSYGGQITTAASNPLSEGSRGFRHWQGDGTNNNSGGVVLEFGSPQPEFWLRWYHRYEAGFKWSDEHGGEPHYDKIFYIHTNKAGNAIFPSHPNGNRWRIATQAPSGVAASASGIGWQYTMGGPQSDGDFHLHEAYVKMDTDGTDGIARLWIDGELIVESFNVNYSGGSDSAEDQTAREGWVSMLIGSNQNKPDNGRCMAVDYDDIVIYTETPPNTDPHGNPWIGPIN